MNLKKKKILLTRAEYQGQVSNVPLSISLSRNSFPSKSVIIKPLNGNKKIVKIFVISMKDSYCNLKSIVISMKDSYCNLKSIGSIS